jgi:activator of HSP90 ATPase
MPTIHQEISFHAAPARVLSALTDPKTFGEVTGAPSSGEGTEGGVFSAFGGHITGRNVEIVPGKRLVQAWRAKTWPEGRYSIARFELHADGDGTRLVLDHDGFPEDMSEHLAKGWHANYWEKLAAYFG